MLGLEWGNRYRLVVLYTSIAMEVFSPHFDGGLFFNEEVNYYGGTQSA
jgi:hypothetical protein